MALIPEIDYAPGEDTMQEVFDKINTAIQNINAVLGGATEDESIRKSSSSDFDYETWKTGGLNWVSIPLGSWDMDATPNINVPLPFVIDNFKIALVQVCIATNSGAILETIDTTRVGGDAAGYAFVDGSNSRVDIYRTTGGAFDDTTYNSTLVNRGNIIIAYRK